MRNIFINVLDGTDDSEFNAMQDEITNIYETARIKHSDKLMKNNTIIGTFTIGITPPEDDRVSAFLAVIVNYDGGKALWFDSTDRYYRFNSKTYNDTIEDWLLLALYNRLRYPKCQMYQLIKEKFFPDWDETHDSEGIRLSRYLDREEECNRKRRRTIWEG